MKVSGNEAMSEKALFDDECMRDSSATALRKGDTFIQQASKRFARQTILPGEARHLMLAYQAGAKGMQDAVLKALCRDCPCRGDCIKNKGYTVCYVFGNIFKVFVE